MESATRKIVLPLIAGMFAAFVITALILGPGEPIPAEQASEAPESPAVAPEVVESPSGAESPATPSEERATTPVPQGAVSTSGATLPLGADAPAPPEGGFGYLEAKAPVETTDASPSSLGSLDPSISRMKLFFAPTAAGISQITFSDFWKNGRAKRQADSHHAAVAAGSPDPPPMPSEDERYVLQNSIELQNDQGRSFKTPILAAHSIESRLG